jgi:hypothetical protein
MRPLRLASLVLTLGLLAWCGQPPCRGQFVEFGEGGMIEEQEGEYQPVSLPISAKAARTWIALHETMIRPLPDQTPFGAIIKAVKALVRGKDGKSPPFEFYLDPVELAVVGLTMETPMASSFVGDQEVSVYQNLQLLLRWSPLVCIVHDGIVIIETPCDDCPGYPKVTTSEAWTWLVLHEVVPLSFPNETPLQEVLQAIQRATIGKGKEGRGLAIYVDPIALRDAKKTPGTKVTIELEHVPLRASLGLILKQVDLGFRVREDGILIISNRDEVDSPMDEAQLALDYQFARYGSFHDRRNSRQELRRLEAKLLKRFRASSRPAASEPRGGSREQGAEQKSTGPEEKPKGPPSSDDRPGSDGELDHHPGEPGGLGTRALTVPAARPSTRGRQNNGLVVITGVTCVRIPCAGRAADRSVRPGGRTGP